MKVTTLALCLLLLGITSYAHESKTGVEFRALELSTGRNELTLVCPVDECSECPDPEPCNECPE